MNQEKQKVRVLRGKKKKKMRTSSRHQYSTLEGHRSRCRSRRWAGSDRRGCEHRRLYWLRASPISCPVTPLILIFCDFWERERDWRSENWFDFLWEALRERGEWVIAYLFTLIVKRVDQWTSFDFKSIVPLL